MPKKTTSCYLFCYLLVSSIIHFSISLLSQYSEDSCDTILSYILSRSRSHNLLKFTLPFFFSFLFFFLILENIVTNEKKIQFWLNITGYFSFWKCIQIIFLILQQPAFLVGWQLYRIVINDNKVIFLAKIYWKKWLLFSNTLPRIWL